MHRGTDKARVLSTSATINETAPSGQDQISATAELRTTTGVDAEFDLFGRVDGLLTFTVEYDGIVVQEHRVDYTGVAALDLQDMDAETTHMEEFLDGTVDPDDLAEILHPDVVEEFVDEVLDAVGGTPSPVGGCLDCSEFGEKVTKFAKYVMVGGCVAAGAACCAASGGNVGACALCAFGGAVCGQAAGDKFDEHCC